MPPKRKRDNQTSDPFRSQRELIPGLLNDIVIECIVGDVPQHSIFFWTKFRAISKLFKRFIEHKFPTKPKYIAVRLLQDPDWVWWKDIKYCQSNTTRLSLHVEENVDYYKQNGGKTFEKKKWLRYVFISPNAKELTKGGYVRADKVDHFVQRALKLSSLSSVEMGMTTDDLRRWLSDAMNKRTEPRRKRVDQVICNIVSGF